MRLISSCLAIFAPENTYSKKDNKSPSEKQETRSIMNDSSHQARSSTPAMTVSGQEKEEGQADDVHNSGNNRYMHPRPHTATTPGTPATIIGILEEEKKSDSQSSGSILQTSTIGHDQYTNINAKSLPSSPVHSPLLGSNELPNSSARSTKSKVSFSNTALGPDNNTAKAPGGSHYKTQVGVPTDYQGIDEGQEVKSRVYTSENLKPQKRRWR